MLTLLQDPASADAAEAIDGKLYTELLGNGVAESVSTTFQDQALQWLWNYAPGLIGALLTFLVGRLVARLLTRLLRRLMEAREVDSTLVGFLSNAVYFTLLTMVIIASLGKLGVETTSFVAIMGAATLALGLSLQGLLNDIASGVLLIFFRPFRVGDFVETGGGSGVVESIGIFVTAMRTGDNKQIVIPNSKITDSTITNFSAKHTRRIDLVIGIGYDDDIKLAKETLESLCESEERVLEDPAPSVAVSELGESSVDLVCRPWVKRDDYWPVRTDLLERIKIEFDARGISFPYPQRDLHLYQQNDRA